MVKIFVFFGHTYLCVFFKFRSIFGNKLFFDPILKWEGKRNLDFSYTTHIKITSRVWKSIWGPNLFSTKKSKMASGSLFFTKSAILPIFDAILILQREEEKMDIRYITHIKRTSRLWQAIWGIYLFSKKSRKMGLMMELIWAP